MYRKEDMSRITRADKSSSLSHVEAFRSRISKSHQSIVIVADPGRQLVDGSWEVFQVEAKPERACKPLKILLQSLSSSF